MSSTHLGRIDALRGIAILGVFFFHSQQFLFPGYASQLSYTDGIVDLDNGKALFLNLNPFAFGASGVKLFLIISGFLIHLGFLQSGSLKLNTFYSKRFWRIYPPYLIALIGCYFLAFGLNPALWTKHSVLQFGLHGLLVHNLWDPSFFSINPSFWSLGLEVQFYLIYPIFVAVRNKIGITKAFGIVVAIGLLASIIGAYYPPLGTSTAWVNSVPSTWYIWCAGALLAEFYKTNRKIFGNGAIWVALASLWVVYLSVVFSGMIRFREVSILIFLLAVTEWSLYFKTSGTSGFLRMLSKGVITLGFASYSLYLIHQPLVMRAINYSNAHFPSLAIVICLITFVVLFAISYLLYLYLEKPSIEIGRKLRNKKLA